MSLRAKRSNPKTLAIASLHFVPFAMTNVYLILDDYLPCNGIVFANNGIALANNGIVLADNAIALADNAIVLADNAIVFPCIKNATLLHKTVLSG